MGLCACIQLIFIFNCNASVVSRVYYGNLAL